MDIEIIRITVVASIVMALLGRYLGADSGAIFCVIIVINFIALDYFIAPYRCKRDAE